MKTKIWSKEDLDFLDKNYPTKGGIYCAEFLKRTRQAITMQAFKRSLKKVSNKRSTEEYIKLLVEKHISIRPLEEYKTVAVSIKHTDDCNHIWLSRPNEILRGHGCPVCAVSRRTKNHNDYELELFEAEAPAYPITTYINDYTKILHKCVEGHDWLATPRTVLRSKNCPICNPLPSFNMSKPAICYYVKIEDSDYCAYKIGITNNNIRERLRRDFNDKKITVLEENYYEKGSDAYIYEQNVIHKFKDYKVTQIPKKWLKSNGYTELFTIDVLKKEMLNE